MPNIFRGAQAQVNRSDLSGRRVWKGGGVIPWWDPNEVGLSIAGAYRAIRSVGTPWGGGPTAYAQTLVNQANPGVNDLTEGNGAVPWVQATGWGFAVAGAQWLDTGLVPANDQSWSGFVQYANNAAADSRLFGKRDGGNQLFQVRPSVAGNRMVYANGDDASVAPHLATGNYAILGNRGYRNGVLEGAGTAVWGGASVASIYIGALNNVGVAAAFCTADIESVAIYNGGAAAVQAEALAIAAAMAAL